MKTPFASFSGSLFGLVLTAAAFATDYHVGPGQPLAEPGLVPWESLAAGDTIFIHWRAAPYAAKWVLCRQGTAGAPITIRGVRGPAGELPVITGENATTRSALNFWNRSRGLLKIGGANTPDDTMPQHLVVESLDLRSARPPFTFTAPNGAKESYVANAAALYVEKVRHLTVRDCAIGDSGNGLFISADSQDILIERCFIAGNGNTGSIYEHNAYTAAIGIVYQFNHFGPLRAGCGGNNLKDRSAGLVVRYNWIEGGNRQLDLVDAEDSDTIVADPAYHTTFVYGNVLIEPAGDGNRQIIHYGGDSGDTSIYRKGTLYLHHNTIVSTRTDRNTLLRLSTNDETCDARNNIVYTTLAGNNLSLIDDTGMLRLQGNWIRSGWIVSFNSGYSGSVVDAGGNLAGTAPGFVDLAAQDFHLAEASSCRDAGVALAAAATAHQPTLEYLRNQRSWTRSTADASPDLGAHEFQAYAAWRAQQFGAGADALLTAEPLADPDGDGATNLLEFALGSNPLFLGSSPSTRAELVTLGDSTHGAIAFTRCATPHGLAYTVSTSPDLTTWTPGWTLTDTGVTPGATLIDGGSGLECQVRSPALATGRLFFLVQADLR